MRIGIIGGSGFEKEFLANKIGNHEIFFLSRHGSEHELNPSEVNYEKNIREFKKIGVDMIIATSACGSLHEHIKPGDIVLPNQFIDWTTKRNNTINKKHTSMAEPFDEKMRKGFYEVARSLSIHLKFGISELTTVITIEGPRFSTRAESRMFKTFAEVINMTTCPEVIFANELGIPYQVICMVTDYDSWDKDKKPVTIEEVNKVMNSNVEKVKLLITKFIEGLK
jgi:5'-methylthioadenosine phosphorylase